MEIEVNNISYKYVSSIKTNSFALNGISFNVEKGDFVAIVGKTGSGKSTLIQMFNGLLLPQNGYIKINDYYLTSDKKLRKSLLKLQNKEIVRKNKKLSMLKKDVGLVFQFPEYQLFSQSILKDCMFGPLNFGYSKKEAQKLSEEALNKVGIDSEFYEKSPFEISGGEKRRVGIASILASKPEILVLDEPTAGLDNHHKEEILKLIKDFNEEGKTVICVTHDMDLVLNYSKKVLVLNEGKLIKETTPKELFKCSELDSYSLELPESIEFIKLLKEAGLNIDFEDFNNLEKIVKAIKTTYEN